MDYVSYTAHAQIIRYSRDTKFYSIFSRVTDMKYLYVFSRYLSSYIAMYIGITEAREPFYFHNLSVASINHDSNLYVHA